MIPSVDLIAFLFLCLVTFVVSCVPHGSRVCCTYWYVSDARSECGNEKKNVQQIRHARYKLGGGEGIFLYKIDLIDH